MNCNDFEANIDRYLDGAPDSDSWREALSHTSTCATCDALVTRYQQATALLQTAVTDRVAAVDVSGLWEAIDSQIPAAPVRIPASLPAGRARADRFFDFLREWAIGLTPVRVGAAMMATAAVVALLVATVGEEVRSDRAGRNLARAKAKAVRIVTMEVPSGYTVSTWSRPRSRTHMISINPAPAYTLASATR